MKAAEKNEQHRHGLRAFPPRSCDFCCLSFIHKVSSSADRRRRNKARAGSGRANEAQRAQEPRVERMQTSIL